MYSNPLFALHRFVLQAVNCIYTYSRANRKLLYIHFLIVYRTFLKARILTNF